MLAQRFSIVCIFFAICTTSSHARILNRRLHHSMPPVQIELVGFTSSEENTIDRAIAFLAARLTEIESESALPINRFERCIAKYATKDFLEWNSKYSALENKYRNAGILYSELIQTIQFHLDKKIPVSIAAVTEKESVWGVCMLGHRPEVDDIEDLYIELNKVALKKFPRDDARWAGTILHEFLHRTGHTHPSGYAGSLIREAEGCIARRFALTR